MKTPVLETDRLILRPVTLDDAPSMQKHFNNWNVIKDLSMAVPWPYPDNGSESFLRDVILPLVAEGKCNMWSINLKEDPDQAIGIIDYRTEFKDDGGNRGFWLAEPFWSRGYMTEAIEAVQDWLFFERDIGSMIVVNAKSNVGSRRVKEKTGARFIEEFALEHRSGDIEAEKWEITKESWAVFRSMQS